MGNAKVAVTSKSAAEILKGMTPEQIRELVKAGREVVKDSKADEKGAITGVKQDDDGTIWLGIKPGTMAGSVGSGPNAGQAYLFQADGITFALDGVNYKLGNVYAYVAKAK